MEIRAVLFDLWGTLILDPEERAGPRRREWRAGNVRRVLAARGVDVPAQAVDDGLRAAGAALSDLHDRGIDLSGPGRVTLLLDQLGTPISARVPSSAYAALESAICNMTPELGPSPAAGAEDMLRHLRSLGLGTALVSNAGLTTAPTLRRMLDWYGFSPYLEVLVFPDELELAKPDGRVFAHALAGLGVPAEAAVFVGDSPHNDVFGARNAGLFAIQVGHRDAPPATGYTTNEAAKPHVKVEALADVWTVIEEMLARSMPGPG